MAGGASHHPSPQMEPVTPWVKSPPWLPTALPVKCTLRLVFVAVCDLVTLPGPASLLSTPLSASLPTRLTRTLFSPLPIAQCTPVHPWGFSSGFAFSRKTFLTPSPLTPVTPHLSMFHTCLFVCLPHQAVSNLGQGQVSPVLFVPGLWQSACHLAGAH